MSQDKAAEIIDFNPSSAEGRVPAHGETAGGFLAAARCAAGLSLEALSDATKVKGDHLAAIEAMRPDLLPPAPYAVGFVKAYARALDLDADALARQFKDEIGAGAPAPLVFAPPPETDAPAGLSEGARLISVFAFIAILLFVFWITVQVLGRGEREAAAPPAAAQLVETEERVEPAAAAPGAAAQSASAASPAPAEETPGGPVPRLKPAIVASALTQSVAPGYPSACESGAAPLETVTIVFDITAAGRAANARVASSSNACFEAEALRALNAWRFSPRTVGGVAAVDAGKRATLNFRL